MRVWPALGFAAVVGGCGGFPVEARWLKASLHVHTTHSDGENSPGDVLRWYARHGYDVVALTDHNRQASLRAMLAAPAGLLVIPGVEFTSKGGGRPVHVSGLFTLANTNGLDERTPAAALERMLAFFAQGGAVAVVNHPTYGGALGLADLLTADVSLLEIYNPSSGSNDEGLTPGGTSEELWDGLLARGRRVYGVAVDDMHALPGGRNPNGPGGGFVMIHARPDWLDVKRALAAGDFYASSGPVLASLSVTARRLVAIPADVHGCVWRVHGARDELLPGGPLRLARPARGYVRAAYDCGAAGKVFLQPLFPN